MTSRRAAFTLILLLFLFGAAFLLFVSGTNSDIQLQVDERVRGRVISIWMLAFGVMYPIGSLLAGLVAEAWGAPATTFAGALACGAWGVTMTWRFRRGPATQAALEAGS